MKTHPGRFFIGFFAAAVILIVFISCGSKDREPGPVVLIGLDGADWKIMTPLIQEGKLPHMAALIKEGSSGTLRTFKPTKSPVIWTSIATGMGMLKHGILDWAFIDENNIQVPYEGTERRVKAIWNILSENDHTVGVINWFVTFPAEEVNGYMVSNRFRSSVFNPRDGEGVTFPSTLNNNIQPMVSTIKSMTYREILREEGLMDYMDLSKRLNITIPENRLDQVRTFPIYVHQDKTIENISLHLYENVRTDFFSPYFRLIDTTSHFTALMLEAKLVQKWISENKNLKGPTQETKNELYAGMKDIIEPVYTYLDNIVGRIIKLTPEKATVIIVSDHGFSFSDKGYNHYNTPDIPHGIIIMKGPGVKPGYRIQKAHVCDITPTLLHLFNLPVGEDMDGIVLAEAFSPKFLKKRKIQYIPSYETSGPQEKRERSRELDGDVLKDLRSLGYIK